MMYTINKVLYPIALLGISLNAYAAMPDNFSVYSETPDDTTIPMTIPVQHEGVRASFAYLLGQPTYNSGFINLYGPYELSTPAFAEVLGRVRPAFTQSGIAATLAYDFNDGIYIQADWLQLLGNTQSANGPKVILDPDYFEHDHIQNTGRTRSTFTRVAADIGQTMFAGDHLSYRLSFGAQYTRVGITENSLINDTSTPHDSFQISLANRKSVFNGIGPRIGLGAEYGIGWNLKLVAQSYASLNVGDIKANTDVPAFNPFSDRGRARVHASDTFRTIIPGLEGSLGVRYDHDLGDSYGVVSGEFGYQVIGYFNSFSGLRDALSSDSGAITSPSSFGQNAIYFKLGYNGDSLNT